MKKLITLFLMFSILLLSGNLYAKKQGAELYIQKKNGQYERGELIAVKKNSLLLKDYYSGVDVLVDIKDVKVIKIEKESKALLGAGIGLGIGGTCGALIGLASSGRDPDSIIQFEAGESALIGAIAFGLVGVIVGGFLGAVAGIDKTIKFEGKTDSEIQEILEELRKKARIKNYQ